MRLPEIDVTNFHTEQRLYTLMLVDPGKSREDGGDDDDGSFFNTLYNRLA